MSYNKKFPAKVSDMENRKVFEINVIKIDFTAIMQNCVASIKNGITQTVQSVKNSLEQLSKNE